MSNQYLVAEGHDVALVSLTALDPQPTTRGVQFTERVFNLDGSFTQIGPYCELLFPPLESGDDYLALLAQFGLDDEDSNPVTVYLRNNRLQWTRYNATAMLPGIGQEGAWQDYFMRNVVILLTALELAS